MSQPTEIELKLDVPADWAGHVGRLSVLRGVKPARPSTLQSTYFDTDEQKLRKSGLSLRVRRSDGQHVQTIKKQDSHSAGLFARNEWEQDLDSRQPDLDAARGTALEPLLGKKLRRSLKPIFETRVHRTVYPIRHKRSAIELTVDNGKVEAAGQSSPLCEIELELKEGDATGLFELARDIAKSIPVQLASKSKADHGYALIGNEAPSSVHAEPIKLSHAVDWATAFRTVARSCLHQIVANEPALRRHDPEAVHQMRIGIRRLRAAISLFADMLAGEQTERMKGEFKWITEELAPARELDVFVKTVIKQAAAQHANGPGMGAIAGDFRQRRTAAFARAEQAVASERFRRLVLDTLAWIEIGDWAGKNDAFNAALRDRPVAAAAAEELRRRRRKIRKQGARLAELDARRRHKLRIRAKKLRYATEFFADAFPGKKSARRHKKFAAKLKELQDALGDLNDIVAHEALAKGSIAAPAESVKQRRRRASKAFAAGRLSGREEARFISVMNDARRTYAAFARAASFWK
jgi:triphosphatase